MQNINLLPVGEEVCQKIIGTDANYRRFNQVRTDILEVKENAVTVRIEQFDKLTDKVLTKKELVEIGKTVFSHLPDDWKVHCRPLEFAGVGMEAVSASWVKNQMKKYHLMQKDLEQALGIDKSAMSKLLNKEEYGFTRWHKAAFWYYFKSL